MVSMGGLGSQYGWVRWLVWVGYVVSMGGLGS